MSEQVVPASEPVLVEPRVEFVKEDGFIHANVVQDVEPILEDAKRRHNEGLHGGREMRHAAEIPNVLIESYCNQHGITYEEWSRNREHIRRLLNDPAIAHFRIWKGRV